MNEHTPYVAAAISIPLAFAICVASFQLSDAFKQPEYPNKIEIVNSNIDVNKLSSKEKELYFSHLSYKACIENVKEIINENNTRNYSILIDSCKDLKKKNES